MSRFSAGEAVVHLTGDAGGPNGLQNVSGRVRQSLDRLSRKMRRVALVGTAAFAGLSGWAIKLASDATETANVFDEVFGKAADSARQQLDQFGEAAGRNRFELRRMASQLGALLGPMGFTDDEAAALSVRLTKLATDLSSFFNVAEDEALTALRAAIVGEFEPLRRLGVQLSAARIEQEALNRGFADSKDEIDRLAKTQATLAVIMEQTSQAQNDAIDTADSFANQSRRLRDEIKEAATEIGMELLPSVTRFIRGVNAAIPAVLEFIRQHRTAIIVVGSLTAGIVGLVAVLPRMIDTFGAVARAISLANKAMVAMNVTSRALRFTIIGTVISALAVLVGWLTSSARNALSASDAANQFRDGLSGVADAANRASNAMERFNSTTGTERLRAAADAIQAIRQQLAQRQRETASMVAPITPDLDPTEITARRRLIQRLLNSDEQFQQLRDQLGQVETAFREGLEAAIADAQKQAGELQEQFRQPATGVEGRTQQDRLREGRELASVLQRQINLLRLQKRAAEQSGLAEAAERATERIKTLRDQLAMVQRFFGNIEVRVETQQAERELAQSAERMRDQIERFRLGGQAPLVQQFERARARAQELIEKIRELKAEGADVGQGDVDRVESALADRLQGLKEQLSVSVAEFVGNTQEAQRLRLEQERRQLIQTIEQLRNAGEISRQEAERARQDVREGHERRLAEMRQQQGEAGQREDQRPQFVGGAEAGRRLQQSILAVDQNRQQLQATQRTAKAAENTNAKLDGQTTILQLIHRGIQVLTSGGSQSIFGPS